MTENRTELKLGTEIDKATIIDEVDKWRFDLGFSLEELNVEKPWGVYWRIPDNQIKQFVAHFFPRLLHNPDMFEQNLSPKLLLVAPNQQLSWQYHERRAENWKLVAGKLGVKLSLSDNEPKMVSMLNTGEIFTIEKGQRHRLISLGEWGLVAEIWKHTEEGNPSDEEDIIRLSDDYGREKTVFEGKIM